MSQASYTSRKTFCGRYVHKHSNNEGDETPRIPRASLLPALQKPLKKKSAKRKKSSSTKSRSKKDKELSPAEEVKESLRHEGLSADQKPESDNLSAVPVQRQTFEMPHISDYHPALMPVHHFVTPGRRLTCGYTRLIQTFWERQRLSCPPLHRTLAHTQWTAYGPRTGWALTPAYPRRAPT